MSGYKINRRLRNGRRPRTWYEHESYWRDAFKHIEKERQEKRKRLIKIIATRAAFAFVVVGILTVAWICFT